MTTSILLQAMRWMRGRGTKSSSLLPAIQMPQMCPTVHQYLSLRHQMSHWNLHLNLNHKILFHSCPNRSQPKNCSLNHSKRKTLNQNWVKADTFKRNHLAVGEFLGWKFWSYMYGILYVVGNGKKTVLAFWLETSTWTYDENQWAVIPN